MCCSFVNFSSNIIDRCGRFIKPVVFKAPCALVTVAVNLRIMAGSDGRRGLVCNLLEETGG